MFCWNFFFSFHELSFVYVELKFLYIFVLQAELMYEMIREWPHYVNVPFPIAKVSKLYYYLPHYG